MRVSRVYPAYSPPHPPIFHEKSKVFKPHQASSALINPRHFFLYVVAIELIEVAYTEKELGEMRHAKSRGNRLDFSDSLDDILCALWNHERTRDKCRAVLDAMREYMLADAGTSKDLVETRFTELKRVLKLDDLESEILILAYIRDQTCFSWPLRVEDREKSLYYAMALDRSYAEVARAMSPQGKQQHQKLP